MLDRTRSRAFCLSQLCQGPRPLWSKTRIVLTSLAAASLNLSSMLQGQKYWSSIYNPQMHPTRGDSPLETGFVLCTRLTTVAWRIHSGLSNQPVARSYLSGVLHMAVAAA